MKTETEISKSALWTGRILKIILVLFLLFDASAKIILEPHVVKNTTELGLPETCIQFLGFYLLVASICFAITRITVLGGLFITAYLGGAVAITFVAKVQGHPYIFPVVFCALMWVSVWLQSKTVKDFLPITKS